jgi:hypothetical protein
MSWEIENIEAIIDFGKNSATVFYPKENRLDTISHNEVLDIPKKLKPNNIMVCEDSHMGNARHKRSLAQPFTVSQLSDLRNTLNDTQVKLKLFPQMSTPRACGYSGLEKSDENDPKSIHKLLSDFPNTSLKNPNWQFEADMFLKEAWEYKNDTNHFCNLARRYDYSDVNSQFIIDNAEKIASQLSETAKECFGFDQVYKKTSNKWKAGQIKSSSIKMTQVYSVLATLRDEHGNNRLRPSTGNLPGWGYVSRHILCMSPFHRRGGVARSNIYHHGIRNWINLKAKAEGCVDIKNKRRGGPSSEEDTKKSFTVQDEILFRKYRSQYCKSIKELFQTLKKIIDIDSES